MKKQINVFEYYGIICSAMKKGILLTTKADGFVNTMTIGWGMIGIEWNRSVFIAYVRESRHTQKMLENSGEFTVNIPLQEGNHDVLKYCGTKSGRDTDKIVDMGLTLVDPNVITVPGIQEFPLTLECRVLYKQPQNLDALGQSILDRFYPEGEKPGSRDHHIAYYGEIVDAYIIA